MPLASTSRSALNNSHPTGWLACCHHGRFDLVFQNPRDVEKYFRYTAYPITLEVMTGFGTLIESAVLSGDVKLREDMGPFQIEIISLPSTVTEGTLTRYFNSKGIGLLWRDQKGH
jgi:hypothetical protein